MPKFLIHERMLCEVTFVKRVDVEDVDAAYEACFDGRAEQVGVVIGDAHAGVDDISIHADEPFNMPGAMYRDDPPQVRKILDISTSHVSEKTAQLLEEMGIDAELVGDRPRLITHRKGDYGWLVYVPSEHSGETDPGFPSDLRACMEHARSLECDWIMFDRDGVTIDALPTYEW